MRKTKIWRLILLLLVLLITIAITIFALTGWHKEIFKSKYVATTTAYGGERQDPPHVLEGELLEFNGKFKTNTDVIVKITKTDDRALFKNGDEICVNTDVCYYDEKSDTLLFDNTKIPEELHIKVGDKVIVEYYWDYLQFEYTNCFFSSLIKKDGRKFLPQGADVIKYIELIE